MGNKLFNAVLDYYNEFCTEDHPVTAMELFNNLPTELTGLKTKSFIQKISRFHGKNMFVEHGFKAKQRVGCIKIDPKQIESKIAEAKQIEEVNNLLDKYVQEEKQSTSLTLFGEIPSLLDELNNLQLQACNLQMQITSIQHKLLNLGR